MEVVHRETVASIVEPSRKILSLRLAYLGFGEAFGMDSGVTTAERNIHGIML